MVRSRGPKKNDPAGCVALDIIYSTVDCNTAAEVVVGISPIRQGRWVDWPLLSQNRSIDELVPRQYCDPECFLLPDAGEPI